MPTITAPDGFVPLAETVVHPDWVQLQASEKSLQAPPLHELPFKDGVCGELGFDLVAETPIFSRGAGADTSESFSVFDRFALPATAVRGWLRNLVEILSFARLRQVNRHRYAVRDLHNRQLYGDHMARIVRDPRTGKQEPMPLVNAGWLQKRSSGEGYEIDVHDFVKIEYRFLTKLAEQRGVRQFQPGDKQSSVSKYDAWGEASREVEVTVDFQRPLDAVAGRTLLSEYGQVRSLGGQKLGTLVFTGQPNRYKSDPSGNKPEGNKAKHHDFVFFRREARLVLPVSEEVFADFEFGHSNRGQQGRLASAPNDEWGHWKPKLEKGERVPVFFLTDDAGEALRAFGLAMMFRLACRYDTRQAVEHAQGIPPHDRIDFAEGLFGLVRSPHQTRGDRDQTTRRGAFALKGRVDCSHFLGPEKGKCRPSDKVETVLGAPKASYYPNYVEQEPGRAGAPAPSDGAGNPNYTTWQDDGCRPRGWKRYRTMTETWQPPQPRRATGEAASQDVLTRFRPLPAGTRFQGSLYLHNVRELELGALLWALRLGGDPRARHAFGMARPLGYGRCRIENLQGEALCGNDGRAIDLDRCQQAFEDYMDGQVPGWRHTPQIEELLALARPVRSDQVRYQRLDPERRINEFVEAKKLGLALPAVANPVTTPGSRSGGNRPVAPAPAGPRPQPGRPPVPPQEVPPPRVPAAPPAGPATRGVPWPGKKLGDDLLVRLVEQNKKGKWRAEAVEYEGARGTLEGTAPPDAEPGKTYTVRVIQGVIASNLALQWKK